MRCLRLLKGAEAANMLSFGKGVLSVLQKVSGRILEEFAQTINKVLRS